jgi:hypothetical protein
MKHIAWPVPCVLSRPDLDGVGRRSIIKLMSNLLTLKTLKKERGWTDKTIKEFLGRPSKTKTNPNYRSAPPMKLYSLKRVEEAEAKPEWQKARDKSKARSDRAKNAADKKKKEMVAEDSFSIKKEVLEYLAGFEAVDDLKEAACKHWYDNKKEHVEAREYSWEEMPDSIPDYGSVDDVTLKRWILNMVRHSGTSYDFTLSRNEGKVGAPASHDAMQDLVRMLVEEWIAERTLPRNLTRQCGDI